jgi:NAD(P)-dependent dehydrogenase (short-subunit alcohol dehydrogenase family)
LLDGKIAVITGAGAEIGQVCEALSSSTRVRRCSRPTSAAGRRRQPPLWGASVSSFQVDVRSEDGIQAIFARAVEVFGRVDILVSLAGNPGGRRGPEVTLDTIWWNARDNRVMSNQGSPEGLFDVEHL